MTMTTAAPAPTALVLGIAGEQAALTALEPLLAAAQAWQISAQDELGAALHADTETCRRASALVTVAVEAHTDLFRLVLRTERRLAALRRIE
jgi:hypothetical protein